tara:strand:+ start:117 stop:1043 length:927 start_codon:yes stop_codon:yes gene_type:complete
MKGKRDILSIIRKILKNEYLTYFVGFFTILFVMEILNSPSNNLIKLLRYTLNYKIVLFLVVFGIVFIGYFNIPLSLLLLTNLLFLMNIKFKVETFANRIPDLVDKNTLISYQKNFGDMKKIAKKDETEKNIKNKINSEKNKREKELKAKNKAGEIIENKKEEIENKKVIGYYDEELNVKNTERLDLDSEDKSDKKMKRHKKKSNKNNYDIKSELKKAKQEQEEEKNDNTLEEELVKKNYEIKKDLEVLEEDESSESSGSSDSSDSSESSDSSDSEGMDDVSMDEAREHVMKKIRNKIKKKYVSKKRYD